MTMSVIASAQDEPSSEHYVNASQTTTLQSKLKPVTRLYPVPDKVPDSQNRADAFLSSTYTPEQKSSSSSISNENIDSLPDPTVRFNLNQIPNVAIVPIIPFVSSSSRRVLSDKNISPTLETITDDKTNPMTQNQSERSEREIRKNSTTQGINVNIKFHPSYEPNSDGLEHDKLTHHTQDYVRKISSTSKPVTSQPGGEFQSETEYTVYVTPQTSPSIKANNFTTPKPAIVESEQELEVVKKSENVFKIKEKSDSKPKYSSKLKQIDKDTKLTTKISTLKTFLDTMDNSSVNIPSSVNNSQLNTLKTSAQSATMESSSTVSSPHELDIDSQENSTSTTIVFRSNNTNNLTDDGLLNDSPASPENATELPLETTSANADYEDLNFTSANQSNHERPSVHGRMLDVAPQAHAEDLHDSWNSDKTLDVAMISGISFGAIVLITLLGAVSFVLYRRYRWNKPQTLNDKCSNPDSSGYIDDSTLRENSEEMYSLDNDSFLNSLEAMTIQNYWTDHVKHTKL